MSTDTRLLPQRTPRATGIAQTQMVNRPATAGMAGQAPPVTASPAASAAVRRQAVTASGRQAGAPQNTAVTLQDRNAMRGRTIPGPAGGSVQSVTLLPNVTKSAAVLRSIPESDVMEDDVMADDRAPELDANPFTTEEMLLVTHLAETFGADPLNAQHQGLAESITGKLAALLTARG